MLNRQGKKENSLNAKKYLETREGLWGVAERSNRLEGSEGNLAAKS